MVRILLDECLPVKLKFRFKDKKPACKVSTVTEEQWSGLKNGKLLTLAQSRFDVFITVDRGIAYQQNADSFDIAIVVLKSPTVHYEDLLPFVDKALHTIRDAETGNVLRVDAE